MAAPLLLLLYIWFIYFRTFNSFYYCILNFFTIVDLILLLLQILLFYLYLVKDFIFSINGFDSVNVIDCILLLLLTLLFYLYLLNDFSINGFDSFSIVNFSLLRLCHLFDYLTAVCSILLELYLSIFYILRFYSVANKDVQLKMISLTSDISNPNLRAKVLAKVTCRWRQWSNKAGVKRAHICTGTYTT